MSALVPILVACAVVGLAAAARPVAPRVPVAIGGGVTPVGAGVVGPPVWFERRAADADLAPAERWWALTLSVIGFVAALALVVVGPWAVPLGALGAAGLVGAALRLGGQRASTRLVRSVPEALDAVARSCRAGSSVVGALADLGPSDGPAGVVLSSVATRVEHGVGLRDALDDLVASRPVPALRLAAAALLVGADTGAAPARAVEGVAATLRDHAALAKEAAGHATQARASAAVLVVAPVGFGVVAVVTDPRVASFLLSGPAGLGCLALGLSLDAVGAWWMSRLVRAAR